MLKQVAVKEEIGVQKNLKDLKRILPLTYGENVFESAAEDAEKVSESEEVDSSDEEAVDPAASLAINAPIDRLNIKT